MPEEPPYQFIAGGLKAGEVVPFFGAAASAVYRPEDEKWQPGKPFMPFGTELAAMLADAASYGALDVSYEMGVSETYLALKELIPDTQMEQARTNLETILGKHFRRPPDLALIASWAEHVQGNRRAVNRQLRRSFLVDSPPGMLHTSLANVAETRLYITTNYDDLLEKALESRRPHVIVDRGDSGLWATPAGEAPRQVSPNDLYLLLNEPETQQPSSPIVFKMHGSVDRGAQCNDSYLITEEDYVDFLGRAGGRYIPPYIEGLIEGKDFLFLGYSLEDWNVRVILRKLLKRARHPGVVRNNAGDVRFWAIVRGRSDVEQQVWQAQNLNIYPMDLCKFAESLRQFL